jgi:outer membrane biosynthesis protein TonB
LNLYKVLNTLDGNMEKKIPMQKVTPTKTVKSPQPRPAVNIKPAPQQQKAPAQEKKAPASQQAAPQPKKRHTQEERDHIAKEYGLFNDKYEYTGIGNVDSRQAPSTAASSYQLGTVRLGLNGLPWINIKKVNGVVSWVPHKA